MSAIKLVNDNEGRRDVVSSDRVTVYTDGYKNLITSSTTPSIADIVTASGVITLSNAYVPGTQNLWVFVNGQLLVQPGVDYTETSNQQITLSAFWLALITADTVNSTIYIVWNRPLPGARDQELNNLKNVTPNIEGAILDNDGGGPYRAAPATPTNPLATLADASAAVASFASAGAVIVPSGGASAPVPIPSVASAIKIDSMVTDGIGEGQQGNHTIDVATGLISGIQEANGALPVIVAGIPAAGVVIAADTGETLTISTYTGLSGAIAFTHTGVGPGGAVLVTILT